MKWNIIQTYYVVWNGISSGHIMQWAYSIMYQPHISKDHIFLTSPPNEIYVTKINMVCCNFLYNVCGKDKGEKVSGLIFWYFFQLKVFTSDNIYWEIRPWNFIKIVYKFTGSCVAVICIIILNKIFQTEPIKIALCCK